MRGGFSFKGIDIASLSLNYAPENSDTYIYRPTDVDVHEETFAGHDGGYFYGVTKKPKEFILRCYFEEENINKGIMEKIHWLFRKGTSGKLIFQQRPWCYYYAAVTDVDDKELRNYFTGFIKVTMKAYYPFARSDEMVYASNKLDYFNVLKSTAFLDDEDMMPSTSIIADGETLTATHADPVTIFLYNPGTEYADVGIEIAGDAATGVDIKNDATSQICKFVALTSTVTTSANKHIYFDGVNGKCVLRNDDDKAGELNSLYHDSGYINLAPAYPVERNIFVSSVNGKTVKIINALFDYSDEYIEQEENDYDDALNNAKALFIGRYIFLDGTWREIEDIQDEHTIILTEELSGTTSIRTAIATLNKITITPVSEMSLTKLNFIYKPTFA